MKSLFIIASFLIFGFAYPQQCIHKNLSKKFDFKTSIIRYEVPGKFDSCTVKISIYKKGSSKSVQKIKYNSSWMDSDAFAKCNEVRSYITKVNTDKKAVDNHFGDFVINDFNFDGLEDFAVISNLGGNGGPEYYFYLQNEKGLFEKSVYLSKEVMYFPIKVNPKDKTLMTSVHANAYQHCQTTYKYSPKAEKWKQISQRFVGVVPHQ